MKSLHVLIKHVLNDEKIEAGILDQAFFHNQVTVTPMGITYYSSLESVPLLVSK